MVQNSPSLLNGSVARKDADGEPARGLEKFRVEAIFLARFPTRLLVSSSLIVFLSLAGETFAADIAAAPSFASQADTSGLSRTPAGQPANSAPTLEIAPQPADNPPARTEVTDAQKITLWRKEVDNKPGATYKSLRCIGCSTQPAPVTGRMVLIWRNEAG